MAKSLGLITLHGMGETEEDYYAGLYDELVDEVGDAVWDKVSFQPVYYQPILQGQQAQVFNRMRPHIDWMKLRKFLLYGFSDAASLEYRKEEDNSCYFQTQMLILKALDAIYADAGNASVPVVVVAQSLGGQVISSYVWDAQRSAPPAAGVWKKPPGDVPSGSPQDLFRRMKTLARLYTTGCNIPIFVAGHENIQAIQPPNADFAWYNFFDEDDVLGWPLAPLSPSYEALVQDFSINASGSIIGGIVKSWNPLSHGEYWQDDQVIEHVAATLESLVE